MKELTLFQSTELSPNLLWFEFDQNNSGGYFIQDDKVAAIVYVQAPDHETANDIFDELSSHAQSFCGCCGTRWSDVYEDEGYPVPTRYGTSVFDKLPKPYGSDSYVLFHGYNGKVMKLKDGKFTEIGDGVGIELD